MEQLPKITLNEKWRYHYATEYEDYSAVDFDDTEWEWTIFTEVPIPKTSPPDAIWLRKTFDLEPMEACVRYFLRCDRSAFPMTIYLRGQAIVESHNDAYVDVEVTDYVSLDDNVLVLAIRPAEWNLDPQESELYLQPILCDDLD